MISNKTYSSQAGNINLREREREYVCAIMDVHAHPDICYLKNSLVALPKNNTEIDTSNKSYKGSVLHTCMNACKDQLEQYSIPDIYVISIEFCIEVTQYNSKIHLGYSK